MTDAQPITDTDDQPEPEPGAEPAAAQDKAREGEQGAEAAPRPLPKIILDDDPHLWV